jgi:hypothetical protein
LPRIDGPAALNGCLPLIFLPCGYLPCCLLIDRLARRAAKRDRRLDLTAAVRTARRLLIIPAGLAVWSWIVLIILLGAIQFIPVHDDHGILPCMGMMVSSLVLLWNLFGWRRFVLLDHARVVLPLRTGINLLLLVIGLGGPITCTWLLGQALW